MHTNPHIQYIYTFSNGYSILQSFLLPHYIHSCISFTHCFKKTKPVSETPEPVAMREVENNAEEHIAATNEPEAIYEEFDTEDYRMGPFHSAVPPATSVAANYTRKDRSRPQQERANNPYYVPQPRPSALGDGYYVVPRPTARI